jgi:hypothetical protein
VLKLLKEDGVDKRAVVRLIEEESDLRLLAHYLAFAPSDPEKLLAAQARRGLGLILEESTIAAGGERTESSTTEAATTILAAAASYDLKDVSPQIAELMKSKNVFIRQAAQRAGAKLGIAGAMDDLYAQLGAESLSVRKSAAAVLLANPPVDEADRAAREEATLKCLGTPAEDYAMRVLVTCGKKKAARALVAILNDEDVRRGVYAGWVLAQLPEKDAAMRGLRRVAIYAMFQHQIYQQGAGIDFQIAPELSFHQVTQRLNPDPKAYARGEGPVRIPAELLAFFKLDEDEQAFAVRAYQLTEAGGNRTGLRVPVLQGSPFVGVPNAVGMDQSYLPLLKQIAKTDSFIAPLMVKGEKVPHFKHRQIAAQRIAALTKEKAAYVGLAGESIDSADFPKPYANQDQLLAKYFVDLFETRRPHEQTNKDVYWERLETVRTMSRQLEKEFGSGVLDAIRAEANRRGFDLKGILPEPGS